MKVTLHVYPKPTDQSARICEHDLVLVVGDLITTADDYREQPKIVRITYYVRLIRNTYGVEAVVVEHSKPFYHHLPKHGDCACW